MSSYHVLEDSSEPPAKRPMMVHVEEVGVGSLVWARLPNSIWWPAMVEKKSSSYYRVVYFDDACCLQGWIIPQEIVLFTGVDDNIDGETCADGVDLRSQLANAVRLARHALSRTPTERVLALRARDRLFAARHAAAVPGLGMGSSGEQDRLVDVLLAEGRREGVASVDGVLDTSSDDEREREGVMNEGGDSSRTETDFEMPSSEIAPGVDGDQRDEGAMPSDADTEPIPEDFSPSSPLAAAISTSSINQRPTSALDGDVGRWAASSSDAVVPASDEAVCPEPGDARFDAVVPWGDDEHQDDDEEDEEDDSQSQGWPSSEALVPEECDGSVDDDDDVDVEE